MNFLKRSAAWMGERMTSLAYRKSYEFPTVTGGFDVFRQFLTEGSYWGMGKRLSAYRRSLYVFACVSKIAQKTASIDWELFRIVNKAGDKQQVFDHPVLDLLYRPNPFQTKEEFFQRYMINKKLAGCNFVLKVRDDRGEVRELWNLRPDQMRILLDPEKGIFGFEFTTSGKTTLFKPEDIIYDSYPDPESDFGGFSPLQPAQMRIDVETYATTYQREFFVNNARPDFFFKTQKNVTKDQKEEIKEAWDNKFKGSKKAGKWAILDGGMDYQQVSLSQREMDYIESLKMTRDDILVAFGVPKPVVAITDDVNLANAKTGMEIFLSETIVPEIKAVTNKLNEFLVYQEYGDIYFLEYENPVPKNKTEIIDNQTKRLTAGTMTINEAREELGDEPLRGGDTLYIPFGMQGIGGKPSTVPPEEAKGMTAKTQNVFRGRARARKILEIKEKVQDEMVKSVKESLLEEVKPQTRTFIPADRRLGYYDLVNKSIDKRGESLEEAMNEYVKQEQMPRLFKALKMNDKGIEVKIVDDVDAALAKWARKEASLTAEFVIPFIAEFVQSSGEQAMALVAPGDDFKSNTERIVDYIKNRAKLFGKETTSTTLDKLSNTLAEGISADEGIADLAGRVSAVYEQFPASRSEMIARTEATSANNLGFTEAYKQSGVANANEWIATNDSRTRDSHIAVDGEVVKLDSPFSNGLLYPGDGNADPSETINCRCVLGPAFKE